MPMHSGSTPCPDKNYKLVLLPDVTATIMEVFAQYNNLFFYNVNIITHADIDECREGNHTCEDVCENIIGSYYCSCSRQGYRLHTDGITCQGEIFKSINIKL